MRQSAAAEQAAFAIHGYAASNKTRMATVTEKVQEALIGTTEEPQLSQSDRGNFLKHAKTDSEGEHYLDEEGFINAVAPHSEDYVSRSLAVMSKSHCLTLP